MLTTNVIACNKNIFENVIRRDFTTIVMSDFPKSFVHAYTSGNTKSSFPLNKPRKRTEI